MRGIRVILFGVVLAVMCCSQQADGGDAGVMTKFLMMKQEQLDALAAQYGFTACWNFIKTEFFGGKYEASKLLALAPRAQEIVGKIIQEPKCQSAVKKLISTGAFTG